MFDRPRARIFPNNLVQDGDEQMRLLTLLHGMYLEGILEVEVSAPSLREPTPNPTSLPFWTLSRGLVIFPLGEFQIQVIPRWWLQQTVANSIRRNFIEMCDALPDLKKTMHRIYHGRYDMRQ